MKTENMRMYRATLMAGRLIFPSLQCNGTSSSGVAVYSDGYGATRRISPEVSAGESLIAEAGA